MSSAAKCCASAAEPPLPQASALPPSLRDCAKARPACAMGPVSCAAAESLTRALSSKCAAMREESASDEVMRAILALLGDDLELEPARRARFGGEAADARGERRAAIQAPGERRVLVARHVAELAPAP